MWVGREMFTFWMNVLIVTLVVYIEVREEEGGDILNIIMYLIIYKYIFYLCTHNTHKTASNSDFLPRRTNEEERL